MKCKTEDPIRNPPLSHTFVFEFDKLYEGVGDDGVFIAGWFVVTPLEGPMSPAWNEYPADGIHNVGELVTTEVDIGGENLGVALDDILEST